jgi:Bacterial capsule synthesis protein PGA_cap
MKTDSAIKFSFVGDVMLGGEFINYAERHKIDLLYPFQDIATHLNDSDILFVNLEGPIFEGSNKRSDVTSLLSIHPSILKLFNRNHICVLNIANNHIMDYGPEGLNHTLMLLEHSKIYYVGAGKDEIEANREVIIEIKGKKIAFMAYTTDERHVGSIIAGLDSPGCASLANINEIVEKISNLKQTVDIICISLHWGYEYFSYPSPDQVKIAHDLVNAGATYVVGHHPHIVQGIENYKNSLIFYSLGNFFLPPVRATSGRLQPRKEISKDFLLLKSSTNGKGRPDFRITGGRVSEDYIITPFNDIHQNDFSDKIDKLSKPLSSDNYNDFWQKYFINRTQELRKEGFIEAFKKAKSMPFGELINTISTDDIKRNMKRLYSVLIKRE